jgi:hypothetical protein
VYGVSGRTSLSSPNISSRAFFFSHLTEGVCAPSEDALNLYLQPEMLFGPNITLHGRKTRSPSDGSSVMYLTSSGSQT